MYNTGTCVCYLLVVLPWGGMKKKEKGDDANQHFWLRHLSNDRIAELAEFVTALSCCRRFTVNRNLSDGRARPATVNSVSSTRNRNKKGAPRGGHPYPLFLQFVEVNSFRYTNNPKLRTAAFRNFWHLRRAGLAHQRHAFSWVGLLFDRNTDHRKK